jgi:hypothetical protein
MFVLFCKLFFFTLHLGLLFDSTDFRTCIGVVVKEEEELWTKELGKLACLNCNSGMVKPPPHYVG